MANKTYQYKGTLGLPVSVQVGRTSYVTDQDGIIELPEEIGAKLPQFRAKRTTKKEAE